MNRSFISGSGLICALGNDVKSCISSLNSGTIPVTRYTNNSLDMPVDMPWYGIESQSQYTQQERFYELIKQTVSQALTSASLDPQACKNMGVFMGSSSFEIGPSELLYERDILDNGAEHAMPMPLESLGNITAKIKKTYHIKGPDFVYGTACSASTNALLGAQKLIKLGVIEHALVLGVELHNLTTLAGFNSLQLISTDAIKPFAKERSGLILGEACAAVVLSAECTQTTCKRNTPRLYIAGGASRCDTDNITSTNTDGVAISQVIKDALHDANLQAKDISGIKAHATASLANDTAEANGLHAVFNTLPPVFALKPYIGHTLGASGIAELSLLNATLAQAYLPATPHAALMDEQLNIPLTNSTLSVQGKAHYLINCFGFGGNNTVFIASHE